MGVKQNPIARKRQKARRTAKEQRLLREKALRESGAITAPKPATAAGRPAAKA